MCDSAETLWQGGCTHLSASRMLDWVARRSQRLAAWEARRLQSSELTATGRLLPKVRASVKKLLCANGAFSWNFYFGLHLPTVIYTLFLSYHQDKRSVLRSYDLKNVGAPCHLSERWSQHQLSMLTCGKISTQYLGTFSPAASISLWLLCGILKSFFVFF